MRHFRGGLSRRRGGGGEGVIAKKPSETAGFSTYGRGRIRTCEGISHQIYSLTPLATWVHARLSSCEPVPAAWPTGVAAGFDRGRSIRPPDRFSRRREAVILPSLRRRLAPG